LVKLNLVNYRLIFIRACHTHWINPAIWGTDIGKESKWRTLVYAHSVSERSFAIWVEQFTIGERAPLIIRVDKESWSVHSDVLRSVGWSKWCFDLLWRWQWFETSEARTSFVFLSWRSIWARFRSWRTAIGLINCDVREHSLILVGARQTDVVFPAVSKVLLSKYAVWDLVIHRDAIFGVEGLFTSSFVDQAVLDRTELWIIIREESLSIKSRV